jgi:hypothetical protein
MILKTDTIPILINYLPSILHIWVLIDNGGRGFKNINEENADK